MFLCGLVSTYLPISFRIIYVHSIWYYYYIIISLLYYHWCFDVKFNVTWRVGWDFIPVPAHYNDVIMSVMASQITSLTIVYSIVYSGADQRKHQSSASLAFVRGIHQWPVNSPHKWPVTRKMFPFDDVIMHIEPKHILMKACETSI